MKRLKKSILLPIRKVAHLSNRQRLYYWCEIQLFDLRTVFVLPDWYYKCLYDVCMYMIKYRRLYRLVDRAIHTIPYDVRFQLA